jgi:predicted amidohydrolase YtcJ
MHLPFHSNSRALQPPRRIGIFVLALLVLAGCSKAGKQGAATAADQNASADVAYINGKIYTVNDARPWAEAVAIKDGKFLLVGSNSDVESVTGNGTKVVDLAGQFAMPGLVDTHTHPFISALQFLDQLVLDNPTKLEDIQQQLAAYANAHPEKEWIEGFGWPKGMFEMENPHRKWLDEVVSGRPVCLMDQGGHAYWCNTLALEKAGVMDPGFQPPKFSIIERDAKGVPSGTVRDMALGHVKSFAPKPSAEVYLESVDFVQELFNRNGVTAHRTATGSEDGLKALQAKAKAGGLTLHWALGLDVNYFESTYSFEERMQQIEKRNQYASEFLITDFAKIFVDGDVSGYGIKMLEPFAGTTDQYGMMLIEPEELDRLTALFDQQGISVQYHAIGSRSIEAVADALEAAAEVNGGKLKTRHYPDHMGFPTARDLGRLTRLNGLIGYAPYFGATMPGVHDSYAEFLGAERLPDIQPARSTLDGGAIIGTGTDWSSLPQDPWPLLEGMTHRRNPWVGEAESEANNAAEAITVAEAIHAYTLGGAHALLREDRIGSIERGKYADFVILDRNLLEIPLDDISETEVLRTVFNGRVVYEEGNHE